MLKLSVVLPILIGRGNDTDIRVGFVVYTGMYRISYLKEKEVSEVL